MGDPTITQLLYGDKVIHPGQMLPNQRPDLANVDFGRTGTFEGPTSTQQAQDYDAIQQNFWGLQGKSLVQLLSKFATGTIESSSYLLNMEAYVDLLSGKEADFSNFMSDFMLGLDEKVRESFEIKQTTEAMKGFSPWDKTWWAANQPSFGSTLALMLPAIGVVGVASRVGKALGAGTKFLLKPAAQTAVKSLVGAGASRIMENSMEASQTYDQTYQELREMGATHEAASDKAGEAASRAWLTNSANLIWDIGQFGLLFKQGRRLIDSVSGFPKTLKYGTAAASEGVEETFQAITQAEATGAALGKFSYFGEGFGERLSSDYLQDGQIQTAAFFGALGGTIFQALGSKIVDRFDPETGDRLPPIQLKPKAPDELTKRSEAITGQVDTYAHLSEDRLNDDIITAQVYKAREDGRTSEEIVRDLSDTYNTEIPRVTELAKRLETIYDSISETDPDLKREIFNIKAKGITINDSLKRVNAAVNTLSQDIINSNQIELGALASKIAKISLNFIDSLTPQNEEETKAFNKVKKSFEGIDIKSRTPSTSFDDVLTGLIEKQVSNQIESSIIGDRLNAISTKRGQNAVLDTIKENQEKLDEEAKQAEIAKIEQAETSEDLKDTSSDLKNTVIKAQEDGIDAADLIQLKKKTPFDTVLKALTDKYEGNVAMLEDHLSQLEVDSLRELAEKYTTDPEFRKTADNFYKKLVKPEVDAVIVDHPFRTTSINEVDELALVDKVADYPYASITKDKVMLKTTGEEGRTIWIVHRDPNTNLPVDDKVGREYMKESDFNALREGKIKAGQTVHYEVNPNNPWNYKATSETFQVLEVVYLDGNKENKKDDNRIVVGQFKSNTNETLGDEEKIIMGDLRYQIWNEWNQSRNEFTASFTGTIAHLWPGRFWNLPTVSRAADVIEDLELAVGFTNVDGNGLLFDDKGSAPDNVRKLANYKSGAVYALITSPTGERIPYRLNTAKIKDVPLYQEKIRELLTDNPTSKSLRQYVSVKQHEIDPNLTAEELYQALDIDNRVAQVDYRRINKTPLIGTERVSYNQWLSDNGVIWTNLNPKQHFHSQRITLDPYGGGTVIPELPKVETSTQQSEVKDILPLFDSRITKIDPEILEEKERLEVLRHNVDKNDIIKEMKFEDFAPKIDRKKLNKNQTALLKVVEKLNPKIMVLPKDKYFGKYSNAYYNPNTRTIVVPPKTNLSYILHEGVHDLAFSLYRMDPAFKEQLDSMFVAVRDNLLSGVWSDQYNKLQNTYGLTDPEEFLAELFSDSNFGKVMSSLNLSDLDQSLNREYTGLKLLDYLINLIIESLGRVFNTVTNESVSDFWVNYLVENESKFIDAIKENYKEFTDSNQFLNSMTLPNNIYDEFSVVEVERAAKLASRVFTGYVNKLAKENDIEIEEAYQIALSNNIQQNLVLSKDIDSVYSFFEFQAQTNDKAKRLLKYINNESEFYKIVLDKIAKKGIAIDLDLEESEDQSREYYTINEAKIPPTSRLSTKMKILFESIPNKEYRDDKIVNIPGFLPNYPDYLDGNYVLAYLLEHMIDTHSELDMLDRLADLAQNKPWIQFIIDTIDGKSELKTQLYRIVQQNAPPAKLSIEDRNGDFVFIDTSAKTIRTQIKNDIRRGIGLNNIDKAKAQTLFDKKLTNSEYLKALGITVDNSKDIDSVPYLNVQIRKLLESIANGRDPFNNRGGITNLNRLAKSIKKTYPSYYVPSYVNVDGEREWAHKRANFVNKKLQAYKRGARFKLDPFYSLMPIFDDIMEEKEFVEYATLNGLVSPAKRVKYDSMSKKDFLTSMLAAYDNNKSSIGFFGFPVFSDASSYGFLSMKKFTVNEAVDRIYLAALSETRRVKHPAHKKFNGDADFRMFGYIKNITAPEKLVKQEIKQHLRLLTDQLEAEMSRLRLSKSPIKEKNALFEFVANDHYMQSQLIVAFSGDPLFYSGTSSFYKRNKQIYSPVTYGNVDAEYIDEDGITHEINPTYKVKYVNIEPQPSKDIDKLRNLIGDKADPYERIDVADSQSWIDPYRFRTEKIMLGEWNHKKERAYKKVIAGTETNEDLKAMDATVVKSFVYGIVRENDAIYPVEHKLSEYMLTPSYAKNHPILKEMMVEMGYRFGNEITFDLTKRLTDQHIDSNAVKVGLYGDYHVLPNSNWGEQQKTPIKTDKITDASQLKKIILANGSPADVQELNSLMSQDYNNRWRSFSPTFTKENAIERIKEQMRKLNEPEDQIRALDTIPLSMPIHNDIVAKVANSIIRNNFTKKKVKGASLYNVSSYGLKDPPRMIFGPTGDFLYAEAHAPLPVGTEGICYRVPIEGPRSIFRFVVTVETPANGGVHLPHELVKASDMDFDIDKTNFRVFETEERTSLNDRILSLMMKMLQKRQLEQLEPGGFIDFKAIADKLKPMQASSDLLNILTRAEAVKSYNDAGMLIPSIANFNAAFSSFQKFGKLELLTPVLLGGKPYFKMGTTKDTKGVLVSQNIAEFAGASVDDRNEPRMSRINVNEYTIDVGLMMLDVGIPKSSVMRFLNHPALHNYVESVKNSSEDKAITEYRTKGLITDTGITDLSTKMTDEQAVTTFFNYKKQAKDHFQMILLTQKSDRGLTHSMSENMRNIAMRASAGFLNIKNADAFFQDKSIANNILFDLGILQGHVKVSEIMDSPYNNKAFEAIRDYFQDLKDDHLTTDEVDLINKSFTSFLVSKQLVREKVAERATNFFKVIPDLTDYPYLKQIIGINLSTGLMEKQFDPSRVEASLVRKEVEQLWKNGTEEQRKYATDLFYYSFLQSGVTFAPNSITHLIPFSMWESIKYTELMEDSKDLKQEHHNFKEQFIANFFPRLDFVQHVSKISEGTELYIKTRTKVYQDDIFIKDIWKLYRKSDEGYVQLKPNNDYNQNQYWNYYKFADFVGVTNVTTTPKVEAPNDPVLTAAMEGPRIVFQEETSPGYPARTKKNASADATLAFAMDFTTAGEKLTKSLVNDQGKKYISINLNESDTIDTDKIVKELNSVKAKSLNIAGNGIYTLKGTWTQEQIDIYVYDILKDIINDPNLENKITLIRTGGQSGVDEAGAKAGLKLGIPTFVLAPKNWKFIDITETEIANEEQFKARFTKKVESFLPPGVEISDCD